MNASEFVRVANLSKFYDDLCVLDSINLEIVQGEFVTLLGPSGSGKSTILQIIAGFTRATSGSIELAGEELLAKPPHKREIGMVFQNYALFENMNVFQNVAYPLRLRRLPKSQIDERVSWALETVRLTQFGKRAVSQLSGGQKQRVALARAFVFQPKLLLMDEPLSALDKNLREQMQVEIRSLHKELGLTTIFVTHDQREALTMSDRIAVLDHGKLLQLDSPRDLYRKPRSRFVAGFLGETSFVPLTTDGFGNFSFLGSALKHSSAVRGDSAAQVAIRSEALSVLSPDHKPGASTNVFSAKVRTVLFQGDSVTIAAVAGGRHPIALRVAARDGALRNLPQAGEEIVLGLEADDAIIVTD